MPRREPRLAVALQNDGHVKPEDAPEFPGKRVVTEESFMGDRADVSSEFVRNRKEQLASFLRQLFNKNPRERLPGGDPGHGPGGSYRYRLGVSVLWRWRCVAGKGEGGGGRGERGRRKHLSPFQDMVHECVFMCTRHGSKEMDPLHFSLHLLCFSSCVYCRYRCPGIKMVDL